MAAFKICRCCKTAHPKRARVCRCCKVPALWRDPTSEEIAARQAETDRLIAIGERLLAA